MNVTTLYLILFAFIAFCTLACLRSRKDPRTSALIYATEILSSMLVALACCLSAAIVGFEAALRAFWSAASAEFKARWNYIAAAPRRTEALG